MLPVQVHHYEMIDYRFEDTDVRQGVEHFYRLQQLDFDGAKTNSNIISVNMRDFEKVTVFPNPASSECFISRETEHKGELLFELLSVSGEHITEGETIGAVTRIDLSSLPAGGYVVRIRDAAQNVENKIIVIQN